MIFGRVVLWALFALAASDAFGIVVPLAEVSERLYAQKSVFPGRVVPIAQVDVVPQVSGQILEVCFVNGSDVAAGDVLYRIDPIQYEAAVKNAEAKVTECKARVSYAEMSFERHTRLLKTRAVSQNDVDNSLSVRDTSRAMLAAAEAQLIAARDDLKHCTVVAPISGRIGTTALTAGNYVRAGESTLVSIIQLNPIRVRFSVSNREILDMFGGDPVAGRGAAEVSVTLANGSLLSEQGVIEYAENAADAYTDTLMIYSLFDNASRSLFPNGTVTVTLSMKTGVPRIAVPSGAVLQDTQGPYVWCLDGQNRAVRRTIARGSVADGWVIVESGLVKGERIVADGAHKVRRGMVVEAAE